MIGAKIILENCIIIGLYVLGYGIWKQNMAAVPFGAVSGGVMAQRHDRWTNRWSEGSDPPIVLGNGASRVSTPIEIDTGQHLREDVSSALQAAETAARRR